MFYIIGLGLCDEKDVTLRGLEVRIKSNSYLHTLRPTVMLGYKKFNAGLSRSLHEHPYDPEGTPGPSYSIPPFVSKAYLNTLDCLKRKHFMRNL